MARPMQRVAEELKDRAANILTLRRIAGWLASSPRRGVTVAERLGFSAKARVLIINADDFGLCHEQNLATIEGLESSALSSASVMVPCAGFAEVCEYAKRRPNADLGVHLTLTSEWERRRWKPVLDKEKVRSLADTDGHFWRNRADLFSFCRTDEVEAELRGQIEYALTAGIDVTHLDSHMFILHSQRKDLQEVYLRLANDYSLPLRTAPRTLMHWYGFQRQSEEADRLGILHPDNFAVLSRVRPSNAADFWAALMEMLPSGLTEICCHPGYAQGDLSSFAEDASQREADLRFFTSDRARQIIESQNIQVVGYRLLRDAMRSSRSNHRM
jgi:predicted glycoside hydrolase/deacetylase ChbG (UPF0249 family)